MFDRTREGRLLKFLMVVDEFTRECLTIEVARKQTSRDVLRTLAKLMLKYGVPKHIRSDNGPEFVARAVRSWLSRLGVETLFIERGSPWKMAISRALMGRSETNYSMARSTTLLEAKVLVARCRRHCNHVRPHSALGYSPPAPVVIKSSVAAAS